MEVRRGWLGVKLLDGRSLLGEYSGEPKVAFVASAKDPRQKSARIIRPGELPIDAERVELFHAFNHPRCAIDQVDLTEAVCRAFLSETMRGRRRLARLDIIWHFAEELPGGLADVEYVPIIRIARALGAKRWHILEAPGRGLSEDEIRSIWWTRMLASDAHVQRTKAFLGRNPG